MILPGMPRMTSSAVVPIIDLPPMTSNTTPAGNTASSSSIFSSTFEPWKAFDGTQFEADGWQSANIAGPWWIQRSNVQKFRVLRYAICSVTVAAAVARQPRDFELQGSIDGTNWITLDSRTGITWTTSQRQEFPVSSPGVYYHYRLYVTASSATNWARVSELELLQT